MLPSRAWLACAIAAVCTACSAAPRPNVVLITLDTTRADHLSAYGHRRHTSPRIDALATEATLYLNARSTSSWTLPAHASIFTGKFPTSHGARYDPEGPLDLDSGIDNRSHIRARGVSPHEETLARRLARAGYATAGFAGGPWLLRVFGLAAGFEHWDDDGILNVRGRKAEDLLRAVTGWLDAREAKADARPFFLFVNFFDPHFPYDPPLPWAREFLPARVEIDKLDRVQWDALYDAEIRYADDHVGLLLDSLRERGVYDDTLVIVTADHGEMLGEHGDWGHNGILFEPLVRVPLLVKPPGPARARVDERPIQLHALYHLVLETAGIEPSAPPAEAEPVLAEVWHPPHPGIGEWKVLWEGPLKFMGHSDGDDRLYDLDADPRERLNLVADRPDDAARLREKLARVIAALPPPLPPGEVAPIDAETRETLELLGYATGDEPAGEPEPK
jgi:arylsulfatase A-like enzyme